jgi:2-keto-3-deoxy-6-phosphogluconate aldolase
MGIVITQFWVTPKFYFPFLQKKKKLHGAVLNGIVQLLLLCKCRDRGEEDFKSFPANFSFSTSPLA